MLFYFIYYNFTNVYNIFSLSIFSLKMIIVMHIFNYTIIMCTVNQEEKIISKEDISINPKPQHNGQ